MADARAALAAAALATVLAAGAARAEDATTAVDRLTEVEQRIEAAREDAALDARLAELGHERIAAAADVQRHEAALTAIEDRLADLEARAAAASAALQDQQGSTVRIAAALVRLARQPPEALLAMPGQVAGVRHSGLLLAALVPTIEERAADLGQALEATAALRRDLAAERDARAQAAVELEERRAVVAALAQALSLPVAGAITRGFGEPVGDGTRSRGLVIGAREAAQVVAPSVGTVVYAGAFQDLGQLLILAHGEEYYSALAGFARIDVVVGQAVTGGEPVGIVGADAGGTTSLYVELRRHGEPVDPLPWLRTAFSEDIR